MKTALIAMILGVVTAAACGGTGRIASPTYGDVPSNTASSCASSCDAMGMKLQSVVLIMNSAGCVCVPPDAPSTLQPPGGPAAAAGGAEIAVEIAAAARRRRDSSSHVGIQHH